MLNNRQRAAVRRQDALAFVLILLLFAALGTWAAYTILERDRQVIINSR